jgi:hypothetical protein
MQPGDIPLGVAGNRQAVAAVISKIAPTPAHIPPAVGLDFEEQVGHENRPELGAGDAPGQRSGRGATPALI